MTLDLDAIEARERRLVEAAKRHTADSTYPWPRVWFAEDMLALVRIAQAAQVVADDFSGKVGQPASLFALRAALEGR